MSRRKQLPPRSGKQRRGGRQTLTRLSEEILVLKRKAARDLYGIGLRLARIKDESLWAHGGHRSFEAYLEADVALGRTTAYELIRITRHFNAEIAARYGYDKLRAVLAWMRATPAEELPGDALAADIRIRDPRGRFETKSLHDATATEIRAATALLTETITGGAGAPKRVRQRLRHLERALPAAPRGTQSGRRLRLRRGRDGEWAVTFQAIPLDHIDEFITALRRWDRDRRQR